MTARFPRLNDGISQPLSVVCSHTRWHESSCRLSSGTFALGSGLGNSVEQRILGPGLGSFARHEASTRTTTQGSVFETGEQSCCFRYMHFLNETGTCQSVEAKAVEHFYREHVPRQVGKNRREELELRYKARYKEIWRFSLDACRS